MYSYMIYLRLVGQDAKPVEWMQSPKGLMAGLLGGSGWHRSVLAPSEGQRSRQVSCGELASSRVLTVSFLSVPGPQNGWNDPPALNRAAKKKKVL